VEEKRRLARAGLAEDVEMTAALLGVEHFKLTRYAGTDPELL
jgi:hypothetical protein